MNQERNIGATERVHRLPLTILSTIMLFTALLVPLLVKPAWALGPVTLWTSSFRDADGWKDHPAYYGTIQFGKHGSRDMVCGRGYAGIYCGVSGVSGFSSVTLWTQEFSDDGGWKNHESYYSTIQLADINGDHFADVCGRGSAGIRCALYTYWAFGQPTVWTSSFKDVDGWKNHPAYYSTIQFPDINGDGKADVCGRGVAGVHCALSTGTSFGPLTLVVSNFSDANGWNSHASYYGTIQFGDINGDRKADVCGRGGGGVYCAVSTSTSTPSFGPVALVVPSFSDGNGWKSHPAYYSTIQLADIHGDGKADVCGRGVDGILCAASNSISSPSFGAAMLRTQHQQFSDAAGWKTHESYYSTIRFPDINGDSRADVCGRGSAGLYCALSGGVNFGSAVLEASVFSNANGWNSHPAYYGTMRFPHLNSGDRKQDVCGRGIGGILCGKQP